MLASKRVSAREEVLSALGDSPHGASKPLWGKTFYLGKGREAGVGKPEKGDPGLCTVGRGRGSYRNPAWDAGDQVRFGGHVGIQNSVRAQAG